MENRQEIKKSTAILLLSVIIVIIVTGGVYFLIIDSDNEDIVVTNSSSTIKAGVATNLFSSRGLQFQYPDDFTILEEQENLPEGNEFNIYVSSNIDSSITDTTQVSISVYQNRKELSVTNYINEMKSNSVEILIGTLVGTINESYEVNSQTVGGKLFEEYLDKITNERTAFYSVNGTMIVISEQGVTSEVAAAYDVILETIKY